MTPTGVDQMMSNYLVYKARCAHLETLIESTELIVAKLHEDQVEDSIRLNALINGMPHAQKGTSDPTGILGSKVASGYKNDHIRQAEHDLAEYKREHEYKMITVNFVEAWLQALTIKEHFVIEKKTLGKASWNQLVFLFQKELGEKYSVSGLRNIRNAALDKIYALAQ